MKQMSFKTGARMTKNSTDFEAKYPARLPSALLERIREKGRVNNRSINQEIVHGMTQYLDGLDELHLLIAVMKRQLVAVQST
ncbi:Arc family DNA-binding protein [Pseudomonas sp. ITA]|nr:Arc family DNA-binding protein [Pseudomonas sp. ITA]